jgi:hypothetical protein
MVFQTADPNHDERRSFERRLADLEKFTVGADQQIKRLVSDRESDKEAYARVHSELFNNHEQLNTRFNSFREQVYERMDLKIGGALTEIRNDFKEMKGEVKLTNDKHDLRSETLNKRVSDLAAKIIWAAGFLAGLQFLLQVVLPWFINKPG